MVSARTQEEWKARRLPVARELEAEVSPYVLSKGGTIASSNRTAIENDLRWDQPYTSTHKQRKAKNMVPSKAKMRTVQCKGKVKKEDIPREWSLKIPSAIGDEFRDK